MTSARPQTNFLSFLFLGLASAALFGLYTDFFTGFLVFAAILCFYWVSRE